MDQLTSADAMISGMSGNLAGIVRDMRLSRYCSGREMMVLVRFDKDCELIVVKQRMGNLTATK